MFKGIFVGIFSVVSLILLLMSATIVGPGERGVVTRLGAVDMTRVLGEGLHWMNPFTENVEFVNVQVQKEEITTQSSSKDQQIVNMKVAINYHPEPTMVNKLFQEIGMAYVARIVDPSLQNIVKAVTARYDAPELIAKRDVVRMEILTEIRKHLVKYNVRVDDFSIVNFNFSPEYAQAIEAKQTASQLADKAENDLRRITIEAQQQVAAARGQAESLALLRQSATAETIELKRLENEAKAIEKWNGVLPGVTGGAMPFVNVTGK